MFKILRADLFAAIAKKLKAVPDGGDNPFTLSPQIQPIIDMGNPANVPFADTRYIMFSGTGSGAMLTAVAGKRFVIKFIDIQGRLIGTDTATYVQVNAYLKGTQCQILTLEPVPSVAGTYGKTTPCEIVCDANTSIDMTITGSITNVTCFMYGFFVNDLES